MLRIISVLCVIMCVGCMKQKEVMPMKPELEKIIVDRDIVITGKDEDGVNIEIFIMRGGSVYIKPSFEIEIEDIIEFDNRKII